MDAYLDYLNSVTQLWTNWMDAAMRLGTNALMIGTAPRPALLVRSPASPDRDGVSELQILDVGKAAPLIDLSGLRIFSIEIRMAPDSSLDPGPNRVPARRTGFPNTEPLPGPVPEIE